MSKSESESKSKSEAESKAKAEAIAKAKAKAEAKAKALQFLAKEDKADKESKIAKLADAVQLITYIEFKQDGQAKKAVYNKNLTVKNRTRSDMLAKYGKALRSTYSYNSDAVKYAEAIESLEALDYIISTDRITIGTSDNKA